MNPKNRPESSSLRPTSYSLIRDKDSFAFTTDKGAIYKITFIQDADYIDYLPFADDVYSFVLEQTSGEYKGRDPRMKQTVIETLERFFENLPQAVIIYNCSQENDHEKPDMICSTDGLASLAMNITRLTTAIWRAENTHQLFLEKIIRKDC